MRSSDKKNILNAITSPLGFFALALLIVEGFLSLVLIFTDEISESFRYWGMFIGVLLFVLVVILVFILVWNRPANLTLEGKHHLALERARIPDDKKETTTEKPTQDIIRNFLDQI